MDHVFTIFLSYIEIDTFMNVISLWMHTDISVSGFILKTSLQPRADSAFVGLLPDDLILSIADTHRYRNGVELVVYVKRHAVQ